MKLSTLKNESLSFGGYKAHPLSVKRVSTLTGVYCVFGIDSHFKMLSESNFFCFGSSQGDRLVRGERCVCVSLKYFGIFETKTPWLQCRKSDHPLFQVSWKRLRVRFGACVYKQIRGPNLVPPRQL